MVEVRGPFGITRETGKTGALLYVLFERSFHGLAWICKHALCL